MLDDLVDEYDVYKVDTSGDCYIVAGGLMARDEEGCTQIDDNADPESGAQKVAAFPQALMAKVKQVLYPHSGLPSSVRVGIHTGSCVSGLIGTKLPKFSLWGDTMNTASRMESTSQPDFVQVTKQTLELLTDQQQSIFKPSGGVFIKGKGNMETFVWSPHEERVKNSLHIRADDTVSELASEQNWSESDLVSDLDHTWSASGLLSDVDSVMESCLDNMGRNAIYLGTGSDSGGVFTKGKGNMETFVWSSDEETAENSLHI
eukprot:gene11330-18608_t